MNYMVYLTITISGTATNYVFANENSGVIGRRITMNERGTTTRKELLATKVASWLRKDIKLNAEAASTPHYFEPDVPAGMKDFIKNDD